MRNVWSTSEELLNIWRNHVAIDRYSGKPLSFRAAATSCATIDPDHCPSHQTIRNWELPRLDAQPRFESGLATLDAAYRADGALEGLVLATPKVFAPRWVWAHNFVPPQADTVSRPHGSQPISRLASRPPGTLKVVGQSQSNKRTGGRRVWAWVRPGPDTEGFVDVYVRWGVFGASIQRRTGDGGVFLTCRVSTPHPAVFVAWRSAPGWVDFGVGPIPKALGVDTIPEVRLMDIAELSQSLRLLFLATWRLVAVGAPAHRLQSKLLGMLLAPGDCIGRRDATVTPETTTCDTWPDPRVGTSYQALREARGITTKYAASIVSNQLPQGQYVSAQQLSDFEAGRRRTRVPYLASMLDRAYGADGFTCREKVNEVEKIAAGRSKITFPYHWVGPVVVTALAPNKNSNETADLDLNWGTWHCPLRVRSGLGITCRKDAPGDGPPLVVEHPTDWDLTAELGFNPEAVDINGDNWDVIPGSERELLERNFPIYKRLFQLAGNPDSDD